MVTSRRENARRIVIAYVVVGAIFFLLYHYILHPADPENPIISTLFYVFLPAILAAAALVSDGVIEGLAKIIKRFFEQEEEIHNEDGDTRGMST